MIRRIFNLCISLLLSVFTFVSCENKDNLVLGTTFVESKANLVCIDTLAVITSTILLDSIKTSDKSIALIGAYSNSLIGTIDSRSYIILNKKTSSADEKAVYDSLVLRLIPSGYYIGDTAAPFTINVNRVVEDIKLTENNSSFYNNTHFDFDPISLGQVTIKPKPKAKEEIRIPINNQLGIEFLNKLKSSANPYELEGGFTNYFKGIVLSGASGNKAILGFSTDTSIMMNLYYHYSGYDINSRIIFEPSFTSLQFNQISIDRRNTIIKDISSKPTSSLSLNNYSFVQGGVGLITRIDFPSISTLIEQEKKFEIVKAVLVVQPSLLMESDLLPENLNLYATNKHNDFLSVICDNKGNTLNGSLYVDYINREFSNYSWDITGFIKTIFFSDKVYNGLLLVPEKYDSEFNGVIVDDQRKSHYRTFLKLYILYYD